MRAVRKTKGENERGLRMPNKKSVRLIVPKKPVNADGGKGRGACGFKQWNHRTSNYPDTHLNSIIYSHIVDMNLYRKI